MKPNANLYRAKANSAFSKAQIEFLEKVSTLNPEPSIVKSLGLFPDIEGVSLCRHTTWQVLESNSSISNMLHDYQNYPFRISLHTLSEGITELNFNYYLKHPDVTIDNPINFKILGIEWFTKLKEVRNPFAPTYAPKRLSMGLKYNLTSESLTLAFQVVNQELWWTSEHNKTHIVPLTVENLDTVIGWHTEEAKKYLAERQ